MFSFGHRLTIPWGSRLDALRLRALSRIENASWMPRFSTLGMGSSSCLSRAWAMRSAICRRRSESELLKAGCK